MFRKKKGLIILFALTAHHTPTLMSHKSILLLGWYYLLTSISYFRFFFVFFLGDHLSNIICISDKWIDLLLHTMGRNH